MNEPAEFPAEFPHAVFRTMPAAGVVPQYESTALSNESANEMPAHLRRQVVSYRGREPSGTIIIDTPNTYLYYVLGSGQAIRYGIGIGREGFTWSGVQSITRKAQWPDWYPPTEMIERQPYLPRFMAGGPGNPLGARAMYLGNTAYRIHGTNAPDTIGKRVSSGCIRLTNEDIEDLYEHVNIGTKVIVLPIRPVSVTGLSERNRSLSESVRTAVANGSAAHRLY
jgi:lipoprotein-anchoring transpeptidase ErfK/SrfK